MKYLPMKELNILFRFTWRDGPSTLMAPLLFTFGALLKHSQSFLDFGVSILTNMGYFMLYLLCHAIVNQIVGFEEDKLDKPNRPLPAGLITIRGAWVRWILCMIAFPIFAFVIGGMELSRWAIAWQALVVIYNLKLDKHWASKNLIFIVLGTVFMLEAAWTLVTNVDVPTRKWIWVVSISCGFPLNLQDFRDIVGDAATGRITLPIQIGETPARIVTAVAIVIQCFALAYFLPESNGQIGMAYYGALTLLLIWVVYRTLQHRDTSYDHTTYMMYTIWFALLMPLRGLLLYSL